MKSWLVALTIALLALPTAQASQAPSSGIATENQTSGDHQALVEALLDPQIAEADVQARLIAGLKAFVLDGENVGSEAGLASLREALRNSKARVLPLLDLLDRIVQASPNLEAFVAFAQALFPELQAAASSSWEFHSFDVRLASCLKNLQRPKEALEWADRAQERLKQAKESHRTILLPSVHHKRAAIYLNMGLADVAFPWLEEERLAVAQLPRISAAHGPRRALHLTEINYLLARSSYARIEERVPEFLADEELYESGSSQSGALLARLGRARLDRARTEPHLTVGARSSLQAASECKLSAYDRSRVQIDLIDLAELEGDWPLVRRSWIALEAQATRSGTPLDSHVRLQLASFRACWFRHKGTDAERRVMLTSLERSFDEFRSSWGHHERVGGLAPLAFHVNRRLVHELIALTMQVDGSETGRRQALQHLLEAQAMNSLYRRLSQEDALPSLDELLEPWSAPTHGFLIYLPASNGGDLFVLDRDGLDHCPLPPTDRLTLLTQTVNRLILSGDEQLDAALEAASRELLPARARQALLSWSEVTVVGSELFGELYFEDLPVESGRDLGNCVAVGYSSSIPLLHALHGRPASSGNGVTWAANPHPQAFVREAFGPLPDLPTSRDGLGEWFGPFGSVEVVEHFGEQARVDALRALDPDRTAFLHLIGHGVNDASHELSAALVLHGDDLESSLLRCEEVTTALRAPRLVALSACAADRGPSRRGDREAATFSGAFLEAGADCVILPPFRVEFHRTRDGMQIVHRELASGASPAAALRQARLESGEHFPRLRAVGLAHRALFEQPLEVPTSPNRLPAATWWVAAGILIGSALVFAKRRA